MAFLLSQIMVWLHACRPKTLWAALCPVLLGASIALRIGVFNTRVFLVIMIVAVLIQIATNLINDLVDARKGTDTAERLGPRRAVQSGQLSERQVTRAVVGLFCLCIILGMYLVAVGGVSILLIGVAALLCAVWYSAGPAALSYSGFAEFFVILFFGPIAVAGTVFLLTGVWSRDAFVVGVGPGFLSTAVLVANNLRDYETDLVAAKKTLVVRFGRVFGKLEYSLAILLACFLPLVFNGTVWNANLFAAFVFVFAVPSLFQVLFGTGAGDFVTLLPKTALLLPIHMILFITGLWL